MEQYLEKGLDTLSDIRLSDALEVLIVNDGSTDSTPLIANKYVNQYPDIFKLINKENGGHGSAINIGIRNASGKYFRVLDGDDWVITDYLVMLINELAATDVDLVSDKKSEIDMKTQKGVLIALPSGITAGKEYSFDEVCLDPEAVKYFMIHNFSVKTALLNEHRIKVLEKVFYEDSEYVLKATAIAATVKFVDLEIYQYMVGNVNQSVSTENFVKRYSHFNAVTKEMLKFSEENKSEYVKSRIKTVILTQYYIAFIYNSNRKQGAKWAKELSEYLKNNYKEFYKCTKKRYSIDKILHYCGFDYDRLQKLRALLGKH